MSTQRPIYPLSCYGPGRDAPRQLIEGQVEISPEELRLRYYTARAAGSENVAVSRPCLLIGPTNRCIATRRSWTARKNAAANQSNSR
jgi:hypothetical protein